MRKWVLVPLVFLALALYSGACAEDDHVHWAYCDSPDTCAACGAAYNGDDIHHDLTVELNQLTKEQWDNIPDEDKKIDERTHYLRCRRDCGYYFGRSHDYEYEKIEGDSSYHLGRCKVCGYEKKLYHSKDWKYDSDGHWAVCKECGFMDDYSENHWANCGQPDICALCGMTEAEGAVINSEMLEHSYDDWECTATEHWIICKTCGETIEQREHWAWCNEPGICADCGMTEEEGAIIAEEMHQFWSDTSEITAAGHQIFCRLCGENLFFYKHWAWCDNPGVCAECGMTETEGAVFNETVAHDWHDWECTTTEHRSVCTLCGESRKEDHWAFCDAPNVCDVCKMTVEEGAIIQIIHDEPETYEPYDNTFHQFECKRCGKVIQENHEFENGKCVACGYEEPAVAKGDVSGDGGVDGRDVLRLMKYLAGEDVSISQDAADVNGDGTIDGRDVLRLMKMLAG